MNGSKIFKFLHFARSTYFITHSLIFKFHFNQCFQLYQPQNVAKKTTLFHLHVCAAIKRKFRNFTSWQHCISFICLLFFQIANPNPPKRHRHPRLVTVLKTSTFETSTTVTVTTTPLEVEELVFTSGNTDHCLPAQIIATLPACIWFVKMNKENKKITGEK